MDQVLELLADIPSAVWLLAALVSLAWTYPRHLHMRTIAGVTLDDRLSIWIANLVGILVMLAIGAMAWFAVRTVLHYMEQGRWPKKALGMEMEEASRVEAQLHRDADDLSDAADQIRTLSRMLGEARETIIYLRAEQERHGGADRAESHDPQTRTQSQ
jgi:hypothetical protein